MRRDGFPAVVLATIVACLAPAAADADIYWHSYDSGNSRIGRANIDGSGANGSLVTGIYFGSGVASDGTHVYWGESGSSPKVGALGRATVGGGDINHAFLGASTFCGTFGLRATATQLYWLASTCSGGGRSIYRAPRDGSTGAQFTVGGDYICGIAVDGAYLYWSQGRYIGRANLDGSAPNATWLDLGADITACGVAVSAAHVYWTVIRRSGAPAGNTIGRATLDGNPASVNNSFIPATFLTSESTPSGIAVDNTYVYWTNQGVSGSIGRAGLDGSGVDQSFVPNVFFPVGLDLDPPPAPPPPGPPPPPPPAPPPPAPPPAPPADPPSPDLVEARRASCLSIPGVVRDQRAPVPGGQLFLVTRQVDDAARPVRANVRLTGRGRLRSVVFRVNGRVVPGVGVRAAAATTSPVPIGVSLLRIGGSVRRNRITATVVLTTGRRVVLTQEMNVLRCSVPPVKCTRLRDGRSLQCQTTTQLGGRRVRITASRTRRQTATGSATVRRGRYTATLRSAVPLEPGTYAYKHVVTPANAKVRYYMIRLVRVA